MVLTSVSVSFSLSFLSEAVVIKTFTQSQRPHGVWMEGRGGLLSEGARWGGGGIHCLAPRHSSAVRMGRACAGSEQTSPSPIEVTR